MKTLMKILISILIVLSISSCSSLFYSSSDKTKNNTITVTTNINGCDVIFPKLKARDKEPIVTSNNNVYKIYLPKLSTKYRNFLFRKENYDNNLLKVRITPRITPLIEDALFSTILYGAPLIIDVFRSDFYKLQKSDQNINLKMSYSKEFLKSEFDNLNTKSIYSYYEYIKKYPESNYKDSCEAIINKNLSFESNKILNEIKKINIESHSNTVVQKIRLLRDNLDMLNIFIQNYNYLNIPNVIYDAYDSLNVTKLIYDRDEKSINEFINAKPNSKFNSKALTYRNSIENSKIEFDSILKSDNVYSILKVVNKYPFSPYVSKPLNKILSIENNKLKEKNNLISFLEFNDSILSSFSYVYYDIDREILDESIGNIISSIEMIKSNNFIDFSKLNDCLNLRSDSYQSSLFDNKNLKKLYAEKGCEIIFSQLVKYESELYMPGPLYDKTLEGHQKEIINNYKLIFKDKNFDEAINYLLLNTKNKNGKITVYRQNYSKKWGEDTKLIDFDYNYKDKSYNFFSLPDNSSYQSREILPCEILNFENNNLSGKQTLQQKPLGVDAFKYYYVFVVKDNVITDEAVYWDNPILVISNKPDKTFRYEFEKTGENITLNDAKEKRKNADDYFKQKDYSNALNLYRELKDDSNITVSDVSKKGLEKLIARCEIEIEKNRNYDEKRNQKQYASSSSYYATSRIYQYRDRTGMVNFYLMLNPNGLAFLSAGSDSDDAFSNARNRILSGEITTGKYRIGNDYVYINFGGGEKEWTDTGRDLVSNENDDNMWFKVE